MRKLPVESPATAPLFSGIMKNHHALAVRLGDIVSTAFDHQLVTAHALSPFTPETFLLKLPMGGSRENCGYISAEEGILHMVKENPPEPHSITALFSRGKPVANFNALSFFSLPSEALARPRVPLAIPSGPVTLAHIVETNSENECYHLVRTMDENSKVAGLWVASSSSHSSKNGHIIAIGATEDGSHYKAVQAFSASPAPPFGVQGTIRHIWQSLVYRDEIYAGAIVGAPDSIANRYPVRNETIVMFPVTPAIRKAGDLSSFIGKGIRGYADYLKLPLPFERPDGNIPHYETPSHPVLVHNAGIKIHSLASVKITKKPLNHYRLCKRVWDAFDEGGTQTGGTHGSLVLYSRTSLTMRSAICTMFSAAPLRKLSATTHRLKPFSNDGSSRIRLTNTLSSPASSTGVT